MGINLLVIEADNFLDVHLSGRLLRKDYRIFKSRQTKETKRILKRKNIDVVLLGLNGLKREGLPLLKMIKKTRPAVQVIIINSAEQISLSIEGMRLGAFDDLFIPFDLDALITKIKEALEQKKRAESKKPSFFQRCRVLIVSTGFSASGEDGMAIKRTQKKCVKDKKQSKPK